MKPLCIVVLAAGKGKRMGNPDLPKVMARLGSKPLISYVLEQAEQLHPKKVVVIIGHHGEMVREHVLSQFPNTLFAVQQEQLGTGHAVMQAKDAIGQDDCDVLILSGDVPLVRAASLQEFVRNHQRAGSSLSVLSCEMPDATGYGRIIRGENGDFAGIVEQRDASPEQHLIKEINSGMYIIDNECLFPALDEVGNNNAQNEYYLTDVVGILRSQGHKVTAFTAPDYTELLGINTIAELEHSWTVLQQRNG